MQYLPDRTRRADGQTGGSTHLATEREQKRGSIFIQFRERECVISGRMAKFIEEKLQTQNREKLGWLILAEIATGRVIPTPHEGA